MIKATAKHTLQFSDNYRSSAMWGYGIILLSMAIVAFWGTVAKIDSAVIAQGTVVLDSRRQIIQSLEGGLLSQLAVREGQSVAEGDLMLVINSEDTEAEESILRKELDVAKAIEARLKAQINRESVIEFPADLLARSNIPEIAQLLNDERLKLKQWNSTLSSQIDVFENRKRLFLNEREALNQERIAAESQLALLNEELQGLKDLQSKGLVEKSRVLSLERESARNLGIVGRNRADVEKTQDNIADLDLQIHELRQRSSTEILQELSSIKQKLDELPKKIGILESKVRRTRLISPKTGTIQNLKLSTIGQVIKPAELLLEIVPLDDALMVQAEISPNDVADVHDSMTAEIRFPSFHSRITPTIYGTVASVSKDRIEAQPPKPPYFLAQIQINKSEIPVELQAGLKAGISADVIVPRGERTVLDYLIQPFTDSLRRTFRER